LLKVESRLKATISRKYLEQILNSLGSSSTAASWLRAIITWAILRASLTLWGAAIWALGWLPTDVGREWLYGLRPATHGLRAVLLDLWVRWDTVHYIRVVRFGYGPDERSAFFLLYPILGRVTSLFVGSDGLLGLLLVSNLAALVTFFLLDRVALAYGFERKRSFVLACLVLYPTAVFLLAAYPQSLLLALTLACALAIRQGKAVLTFVLGIAAGLTHPTALPLTLYVAATAFQKTKQRLAWLLVALGPVLGIGLFLAWRIHQDYPPYSELLHNVWGRQTLLAVRTSEMLTGPVWLARGWPNLLALVLGFVAVVWAFRNAKTTLGFYQAGLLILLVLSGTKYEPLAGLARYSLIGFPLFLALSDLIPQGRIRLLLLGLAIGIQLYISGLFLLWGFVG
jgi:hypothetical protein